MSWALVTAVLLAAPPADVPVRDKLRLGVDWRLWGRALRINAPGSPETPLTAVGASPTGLTLDVQWFPAAYFVDDRGADVGITMRVDTAPDYGISLGTEGTRFVGSTTQLRTGMMFRLPFRYAEPAFHAGYHLFEATSSPFANDGTPRPPVPNVSMQGPRLALSLRLIEFWRVTFDVAAGATWLMGLGEIAMPRFFPEAKGSAFDVKGGLAFRTWKWLDVRLGVDVTVHALALDKAGTKTATDAYYGVSLGIVFKGLP
ncbi:MAG: hypothetical protein QM817_34825 [Archangium sp.]